MQNYWIKQYRRKQNRQWTAEFARNGLFVLQPRPTRLSLATSNLLKAGDRDSLSNIELILNDSTAANELVSFIKTAKVGMGNMYARLRMFEGLFPQKELENYELTGLTYLSCTGGWISSDLHFEFTCNHIRQYILLP